MTQSLQEALTGDSRPTLMFLWAAVGLILLIACVNVMHLQLVRSMERQREIAIRKALGSSRWQVMQPVFLESLLVSLIGGSGGCAAGVSHGAGAGGDGSEGAAADETRFI